MLIFANPGLFQTDSKNSCRCSGVSSAHFLPAGLCRKPPTEASSPALIGAKFALRCACCSASMGWLFSGVAHVAERWYMTSDSTSSTIAGPICTPVDPVPMTATRLPRKSTGSFGQRTGW